MIDIQLVRDNPDLVREKTKQKGYKVDIDKLLKLDKDRKELLQQTEELRANRNEVAGLMKSPDRADKTLIERGRNIKIELAEREKYLRETEEEWTGLLKQIPNIPTDDVPVGASEADNVVSKTVGDKPKFDFKPKNHWEIAQAKDWIDKERGAKVAGARFVYIKGDLARLEFALWQFAIDTLTDEEKIKEIIAEAGVNVSSKPFQFILPPAVAKTEVYEATGRLDKEETTYKLADDDLWLNASAEHVLSPMYLDEILEEKDLPIRYLGYTTAFRREAGSYGKDMEGIFRLHQFNKLEMESFTTKDISKDEHFFMIAIQEYLMACLGLSYQVLTKCTADIGFPNARGVDIEVWLPGQNKYRETHTADYITDFQARRMKTRVKRAGGETEFVHTNDATAFAERPLIGIIENNQTKEGDVIIPEILRKYMGNKEKI